MQGAQVHSDMTPDTDARLLPPTLGIVAIGRNEGTRLRDCLLSLPKAIPTVYVDSASTDDSVAFARSLDLDVVELRTPPGMSAARARNEGFARLTAEHRAPQFAFFIDGDCILDSKFLPHAAAVMASDGQAAVIVGQLMELEPERNVFGRLAALEWASGAGEIVDFGNLGGIMLVRADDFQRVGGFDPNFIAGEDSELGIRLFLAGRKIIKIDRPMAAHRMEMNSFGQWWKRSVRAGHALGQRYFRHGRSPLKDSRKAFFSTLVYGMLIPAVVLAAMAFNRPILLPAAALYLVPAFGFARHYRSRGASFRDAITGAIFGILSKFANAVGVLKFLANRLRGRFTIIEYK